MRTNILSSTTKGVGLTGQPLWGYEGLGLQPVVHNSLVCRPLAPLPPAPKQRNFPICKLEYSIKLPEAPQEDLKDVVLRMGNLVSSPTSGG
jgi:hypothetical protein